MTLQEIIDIAKNSELNTLHVKDNDQAIVGFVNLGLIELYGIFPLRTEEYLIELQSGKTIYDLPSDFMYLVGAYEEVPIGSPDNSNPMPINEENNPFSLNTISYNQVQVPLSVTGSYISLLYVPKPVKMRIDLPAPAEPNNGLGLLEELPIPEQLTTCLLNFIAFKGHGAVNTGVQDEADVYYRRFKASCEDVKTLGIGITPDDLSTAERVKTRGFV